MLHWAFRTVQLNSKMNFEIKFENIFEKLQGHNPYKEKVNCVNIQKEIEAVTNKYPNVFQKNWEP